MMVTTGVVPMRWMEWEGSISWTVVVWGRRLVGRVHMEVVMVVQLAGAGEDVSIRRSDVVTKVKGVCH